MGKIHYLLPLYKGICQNQIARIHKVVMCSARAAVSNPLNILSNKDLLSKCKWLPIQKLINQSALNMLHKIIINKTPNSLYKLYKIPNRRVVDITTKYIPKAVKTQKSYIYSTLKDYNRLPPHIKNSNNLKKTLKAHLFNNSNDTND